MTAMQDTSTAGADRIIISVDAMGGDRGPAAVVAGISMSAKKNPDLDPRGRDFSDPGRDLPSQDGAETGIPRCFWSNT